MDSLIRFFFHHADYYSTISDTINGGIYAIVALIVIAIIIRIVTILIARSCYVIETENNTGIFVVSTIIACIYSTFEYLTIVYITSFFSMGWFIALNIFYIVYTPD